MPYVNPTNVPIMPDHHRALCPLDLGVTQGIRPYALCHALNYTTLYYALAMAHMYTCLEHYPGIVHREYS
jgi:hypothetical protein